MSDFTSQVQRYDAAAVDKMIADMQSELDSEAAALKVHQELNSEQKMADAQNFLAANADSIAMQLQKMTDLDRQIRDMVAQNDEMQAENDQYAALVTSAPYVDLAGKIAQLNSVSAALNDFLSQKGRRTPSPASQ